MRAFERKPKRLNMGEILRHFAATPAIGDVSDHPLPIQAQRVARHLSSLSRTATKQSEQAHPNLQSIGGE
jgi:hypothetical protein